MPDRNAGRVPLPTLLAAIAALLLATGGVVASYLAQNRSEARAVAQALAGGHSGRAPELMRRYGCAGCHSIPGVPGADGKVGPPLSALRQRVYIAGVAQNTAENLIAWIVSPQAFSPRSAMPRTGISVEEARDVATFLYMR